MKNHLNIRHLIDPVILRWIIIITILLLLLVSNTAGAQGKISFTVRGGVNYPCHGQNDLNLHNGYGFEGIIGYRFIPQLSVYTGWGYNTFDVEGTMEGSEVDFVANGYSLGLQFDQPIAASRFSIMVGGGGIYHHLEIENDAGDVLADSKHGLGYQVDLGIGIRVANKLILTPGLKYRSIERDFNFSDRNTRIDLNYLSAGAGIGWEF